MDSFLSKKNKWIKIILEIFAAGLSIAVVFIPNDKIGWKIITILIIVVGFSIKTWFELEKVEKYYISVTTTNYINSKKIEKVEQHFHQTKQDKDELINNFYNLLKSKNWKNIIRFMNQYKRRSEISGDFMSWKPQHNLATLANSDFVLHFNTDESQIHMNRRNESGIYLTKNPQDFYIIYKKFLNQILGDFPNKIFDKDIAYEEFRNQLLSGQLRKIIEKQNYFKNLFPSIDFHSIIQEGKRFKIFWRDNPQYYLHIRREQAKYIIIIGDTNKRRKGTEISFNKEGSRLDGDSLLNYQDCLNSFLNKIFSSVFK
jgi:hypothetical protein